jgi:hypothetical protein
MTNLEVNTRTIKDELLEGEQVYFILNGICCEKDIMCNLGVTNRRVIIAHGDKNDKGFYLASIPLFDINFLEVEKEATGYALTFNICGRMLRYYGIAGHVDAFRKMLNTALTSR